MLSLCRCVSNNLNSNDWNKNITDARESVNDFRELPGYPHGVFCEVFGAFRE